MLLPSDSAMLMSGYDAAPFEGQLADEGQVASSATIIEVNDFKSQIPALAAKSASETQCSECSKKFSTYKAKSQHERLVHSKVV